MYVLMRNKCLARSLANAISICSLLYQLAKRSANKPADRLSFFCIKWIWHTWRWLIHLNCVTQI